MSHPSRHDPRFAAWARGFGLVLLLVACAGRADAQTDLELQRFMERERRALEGFASREDSAFASFLDREWKAFQGFATGRPFTAPKVTTPPRAPAPATIPALGTTRVPPASPAAVPADATVLARLPALPARAPTRAARTPAPAPRLLIPDGRLPDVAGPEVRTAAVPFYGGPVPIRYLRSPVPTLARPVNSKAIAAFYRALAAADWALLSEELRAQSEALALDDYAYAQFVLRLGRVLAGDEDRARLLTWYLLLKSEVDARVGYTAAGGPLAPGTVVLLVPSTVAIYGTSYFTLGGGRFYAVSLDAAPPVTAIGSLVTYDGETPGRPRAADLRITRTPALPAALERRTLTWRDGAETRRITVTADRSAVRYLEWFPQVEWDVWFGIRMSDAARTSLVEGLRPLVTGQSEREAVNTLLRFVQLAFTYQTDDAQFGREKPMSVDETLHYPASDCEDRSILFAALVRELLGLEVVGLLYPGHMATAVRFNVAGGGDVVQVGGVTWTVADPTYLGAAVGQAMPQFKSVTPTLIRIRP